ncbi:hypothetical protein PWT90_07660 [Aphanocladium album]|nr:hypothetical protein PWT90_07660 [Aphanocladium album]
MTSLHKILLFVLAAAAAATAATLLSNMQPGHEFELEYQARNLSYVYGHYDPLSPRKMRHPPECTFQGNKLDFSYHQIKGLPDGQTACFGWNSPPKCHSEQWSDPDYSDFQHAMSEQLTKDGRWRSSTSGECLAAFFSGTTAFHDRDNSLFDFTFASNVADGAWDTYYFSHNDHYASVSNKSAFPCGH